MFKKSNLSLQGDLPLEIIKEKDGYSAFCSTLNLASQGKTIEEAIKMFGESFSIFIDDLLETNTLEHVFFGGRLEN